MKKNKLKKLPLQKLTLQHLAVQSQWALKGGMTQVSACDTKRSVCYGC
jgi:hypothetical protein